MNEMKYEIPIDIFYGPWWWTTSRMWIEFNTLGEALKFTRNNLRIYARR